MLEGVEPLPGWFRWSLRVALCAVVAFALTGMPLAMAAAFRPLPVVVLTAIGTAALTAWTGPRAESVRSGPRLAWPVLAAVALAGVSVAVNAHFAAEHVLADRDPGIYLWHGRWIANTGRLLVDFPQAIFHPLEVEHLCPETCTGAPGGRLYVQFMHLFPAALAVGAWLGDSVLASTNAIIGGLSLLAFFAFATRLLRPLFALVATAALAINLAQVYFTRDSFSEVLAQALLFGGLYLLWNARRSWDPRSGALAGLAIGATCIVRIDSFLYLIPLAAYLMGETAFGRTEPRTRRRFAAAVAGGLAVTATLGFVDLYGFSRGYFELQSDELRGIGIALGAVILAGGAAILADRRAPMLVRAWVASRRALAVGAPAVIVALALYAGFVRPHVEHMPVPPNGGKSLVIARKQYTQGLPVDPTRGYGENSMVWLSWYVGAVGLAAGVLGLALLTRRAALGRAELALPFLSVFLAVALLYIWRPSIFPDQIWAMRRYLPVVIPGFLLLAAFGVQELFRSLPAKRAARAGGSALGVGVLAAMLLVPAHHIRPLYDVSQQAGGLAAIHRVCDAIPPRGVALTSDRLREPVHAFCGVPTGDAAVEDSPARFRHLAVRLRGRGRPLFLVTNSEGTVRRIFGKRAARRPIYTIRYDSLVQQLTRRPWRYDRFKVRFYVLPLERAGRGRSRRT